jgi:post-segregation antitoxin (ccd killing protein)
MKPDKFKKKNLEGVVSARVDSKDLEKLKANCINLSHLIRRAIADAARSLK